SRVSAECDGAGRYPRFHHRTRVFASRGMGRDRGGFVTGWSDPRLRSDTAGGAEQIRHCGCSCFWRNVRGERGAACRSPFRGTEKRGLTGKRGALRWTPLSNNFLLWLVKVRSSVAVPRCWFWVRCNFVTTPS